MSGEERIRRAEEIYRRRKQSEGVRLYSNRKEKENKETNKIKKMLLQLFVCFMIYVVLYLIKNSNYIFSEDVTNKVREFLSHDINIQEVSLQITKYYGEMKNSLNAWIQSNKIDENQTENKLENEQIQENVINDEQNQNVEQNEVKEKEVSAVPVSSNIAIAELEKVEENLTQEQKDIKYIKENFSLIKPINGVITSRFGLRDGNNIVSQNHGGLDIGANTGTIITSAMEGTVSYISSEGDYGNHVFIDNKDVSTLYAHCSKIYVKQGDYIKQGDKIGEVGATGRATGPHLHFEIRIDNRKINPEDVLTFE